MFGDEQPVSKSRLAFWRSLHENRISQAGVPVYLEIPGMYYLIGPQPKYLLKFSNESVMSTGSPASHGFYILLLR